MFSSKARAFALAAFFGAMPTLALATSLPEGSPQLGVSHELAQPREHASIEARAQYMELNRMVSLKVDKADHDGYLDSVARENYVAAQRDFKNGDYLSAIKKLQATEKAIDNQPGEQAAE
jgi:hypothetical protein